MQNVSFKTIEEFLAYLPDPELKIVQKLRAIILSCIPDCKEKLAYNVPYYYRHSRICFIWPASVSWGGVTSKGVRLGFANGNLLNDEINYLDKADRKQVYWKDFTTMKDIDTDLLRSYVFDAVMVDEQLKKAKKK